MNFTTAKDAGVTFNPKAKWHRKEVQRLLMADSARRRTARQPKPTQFDATPRLVKKVR
jgi:hypothetical protein